MEDLFTHSAFLTRERSLSTTSQSSCAIYYPGPPGAGREHGARASTRPCRHGHHARPGARRAALHQFRELLGKERLRSFDELTSNKVWADEIRDLYNGDIDRVDTQVGMLAEDLPAGFGFSDTAFRVFTGWPQCRRQSDRFFTTDWTPETYTQVGMDWINSMTCPVLS